MDRYQNILETFDRAAGIYQDKFMDQALYNDTYDLFCRQFEKRNPKIFEIGCGPGNITRYMLSKRPDFDILAIDVAPNMIKLAKENNPGARFKVMDCREIDQMTDTFDGIMCGFCMPYLSKEECANLIRDCAQLLHGGGVLYFSTMEGDYSTSRNETSSDGQHTMFTCYHEENYLREMLRENDFRVISFKRSDYRKPDGTVLTDMIFISVK